METFSTGSALHFGWETFKKRPWFIIGSMFAAIIAYTIISAIVTHLTQGGATPLRLLGTAVNFVFQILLGTGITHFILRAHDDAAAAKFSDIWHPKPFWSYLGTSILYIIMLLIGFVLLIIPGIIVMLVFQFSTYNVIDRNMGPIAALKESARITKGARLELLLFILAVIGLNLVGLVCVLIGLLITVPVSALATVHVYRTLQRAHASSAGTASL